MSCSISVGFENLQTNFDQNMTKEEKEIANAGKCDILEAAARELANEVVDIAEDTGEAIKTGFEDLGNAIDDQFGKLASLINQPPPISKLSINMNRVTSNVRRSIMTALANSSTKVVAIQDQGVTIRGNCCPGMLQIEQGASVKLVDNTTMNTSFTASLGGGGSTGSAGSAGVNGVDLMLMSMAEQYNRELDRVAPYIDVMVGKYHGKNITTAIKNSVWNSVESEEVQSYFGSKILNVIGAQKQTVNLTCSQYVPIPGVKGGTCKINQSLLVDAVITNTFEVIFKQVQNDPMFVKAMNDLYTDTVPSDVIVVKSPSNWWLSKVNLLLIVALVILVMYIFFHSING